MNDNRFYDLGFTEYAIRGVIEKVVIERSEIRILNNITSTLLTSFKVEFKKKIVIIYKKWFTSEC